MREKREGGIGGLSEGEIKGGKETEGEREKRGKERREELWERERKGRMREERGRITERKRKGERKGKRRNTNDRLVKQQPLYRHV